MHRFLVVPMAVVLMLIVAAPALGAGPTATTQVVVERVDPQAIDGGDGGSCGQQTYVGYIQVFWKWTDKGITLWQDFARLRWTWDSCARKIINPYCRFDGTGPNTSYVEMTNYSPDHQEQQDFVSCDIYANYRMVAKGGPVDVGYVWNTAAHFIGKASGFYETAHYSSDYKEYSTTCWYYGSTGCGFF